MIRLIRKRLIIPRGDTGAFSIPTKGSISEGDIAVFGIFDPLTRRTVVTKMVPATTPTISIGLVTDDTVDLEPRKYNWDISIYKHPYYDEDGELIGAEEVHSYYSAFRLPICEITEVALDVCKERWKTRDLLDNQTQIATGGFISSIESVYPWEELQQTQLEEMLYNIAKNNGYTGSIEDFGKHYASIFAGGSVVKGSIEDFPFEGDAQNLYLDSKSDILYYYKVASQVNMELVNYVAAKVAGIDDEGNYHLYIPIKAAIIENLIITGGGA